LHGIELRLCGLFVPKQGLSGVGVKREKEGKTGSFASSQKFVGIFLWAVEFWGIRCAYHSPLFSAFISPIKVSLGWNY